jgi:hypothetical protein
LLKNHEEKKGIMKSQNYPAHYCGADQLQCF